MKVGGDKGAGTVKVFFQLCNVPNPNSVQNTCVFSVFKGKNTTTNLHVSLDQGIVWYFNVMTSYT